MVSVSEKDFKRGQKVYYINEHDLIIVEGELSYIEHCSRGIPDSIYTIYGEEKVIFEVFSSHKEAAKVLKILIKSKIKRKTKEISDLNSKMKKLRKNSKHKDLNWSRM